jgi:hypothetical protein
MRKNSKYPSKYRGEYLAGNWQYWNNLHALPSASLFCSGQFVFKAILVVLLQSRLAGGHRKAPRY